MVKSLLLLSLICVNVWAVTLPLPVTAQVSPETEQARTDIESLLDRFRQAAADADGEAYFDCIAEDAILFGTDESERWTVDSLHEFLDPVFASGSGWQRNVLQRHVHVGSHGQIGWFEEISERIEGVPMRTTGVVRHTDGQWKIVQYNTSFAIPNEIVADVAELIREAETGSGDDDQPGNNNDDALTDEQHQQVRESFDYVWQKVRDSYWDENLGGVDWEAARDELQPRLEAAETMAQARRVLDELVSRMKVSHFSIIPSEAYRELGTDEEPVNRRGETGLDVRIVGDDVVVVAVRPDTPAAEAGIRPGWILTRINEIDIPARLTAVREELADNPHARVILASAANSRLRGPVGESVSCSFQDENDQTVEHTLNLITPRGKAVQFGHLPEFSVWIEQRTLDNGIGYFRFNAFMHPPLVMGQFNQFMTDHMDAPGIIIDVRANGGGMGEIAVGMIGWLMQGERQSLGKIVLRDQELKMVARPRATTYDGAVVVLIDEMSVSAAEFFAQGIKQATNARLIGTRTAGAVLGSQIEKLPNGDGFQFAAANFITADTGETLEGIGVSPHETVAPDRQSLLAGKDPAIEAAVQWITNQKTSPTNDGDAR